MNILFKYRWQHYPYLLFMVVFALLSSIPIKYTYAQDAECAEVKIVIEQKLSFERQAFDAHMVINNGLTDSVLENVKIELLFTDQNNQPVVVTQDPNAEGANFFYRTNSLTGINNIAGTGKIAAKSTAEIHWLIIPSFGAAEKGDTLYYVGAKVSYTLSGQESNVEVTPDYVIVKPQPMLTLDYFLPGDVYADDPFTPEVEPAIPFTLGVRIKNTGLGTSYKTMIDSAQPKIVENKQGLLVDFKILSGYVADQLVANSLLLNFGDIGPLSSTVGRWDMITSLAGKFVELDATFTHADTLGGKVTSLLKEVNTHTLVHDVKVDVMGRDSIKDFLALDGDILRLYESEGIDSEVADQSASASLQKEGRKTKLVFPATEGFVYTKLTDPNAGKTELVNVKRSDGKRLPQDNVWLSKTRNEDLSWSYFINLFDTNSTGEYSLFEDPMNQIIGTSGNDTLYGTADDDYIDGKEGDDTLYGQAGNDILIGGIGNDNIQGIDGDDRLEAGEGIDQLSGHSGNDTLIAGPGDNELRGNSGDDIYIIHKGDGSVTINDSGSQSDKDRVIFEDLKFTDVKSIRISDSKYYTLVIAFKSGDRVNLVNRLDPNNQIANYEFADGVILTTEQLFNAVTTDILDNSLMYFNSLEDKGGSIWKSYNNAKIMTDDTAIANHCLSLDSIKQSYLYTDSNEPLNLGLGDFTIEFWVKPNVFDMSNQVVISAKNIYGGIIRINFDGNMPVLTYTDKYYRASGMNVVNNPIPVGVWSHVAVTRDGSNGNIQWFLNGKKRAYVNSGYFSLDFKPLKGTYIGTEAGRLSEPGPYFNGCLNQLRVSPKIRYTDDFTPSRELYLPNAKGVSLENE